MEMYREGLKLFLFLFYKSAKNKHVLTFSAFKYQVKETNNTQAMYDM